MKKLALVMIALFAMSSFALAEEAANTTTNTEAQNTTAPADGGNKMESTKTEKTEKSTKKAKKEKKGHHHSTTEKKAQ